MRIHPLIKLLIFAALISALSCATTPKVTDIAELHYGDNEADIVERFGRGSSVLFFDISGLVYHLRSYTTALTEDDYALLFTNGRLVSVSEEIPLYEDCMLLNEIIDWEECLSDLILKMRGDAFDMNTHDISEDFDRQKQQEDKLAGTAVLVTVVAVPSAVIFWPVGVACVGMDAAYNNGVIDCREIMQKITKQSYGHHPRVTIIAGNEKFPRFATTPTPLPKPSWKSSAWHRGGRGGRFQYIWCLVNVADRGYPGTSGIDRNLAVR